MTITLPEVVSDQGVTNQDMSKFAFDPRVTLAGVAAPFVVNALAPVLNKVSDGVFNILSRFLGRALSDKHLGAYYEAARGQDLTTSTQDPTQDPKVDHIIAFYKPEVNGDLSKPSTKSNDLREYEGKKSISVGGQTYYWSFKECLENPSSSRQLIDNIISEMKAIGAYKVDVDYEFPNDVAERKRVMQFMTDLSGKLSANIPGSEFSYGISPLYKLLFQLDRETVELINNSNGDLQYFGYDLTGIDGREEGNRFFNGACTSRTMDPAQVQWILNEDGSDHVKSYLSVEDAVQLMLEQGVNPGKINIGIPAYPSDKESTMTDSTLYNEECLEHGKVKEDGTQVWWKTAEDVRNTITRLSDKFPGIKGFFIYDQGQEGAAEKLSTAYNTLYGANFKPVPVSHTPNDKNTNPVEASDAPQEEEGGGTILYAILAGLGLVAVISGVIYCLANDHCEGRPGRLAPRPEPNVNLSANPDLAPAPGLGSQGEVVQDNPLTESDDSRVIDQV